MKKNIVIACLCSSLLVMAICLISGQANSSPFKSQEIKSSGHPVMLGDQIVFYIKDIMGYPAEARSKTIAERVKRIAENPAIDVTSVEISPHNQPVTLMTAGNQLIMLVFSEDGKAEGLTREEVATEYSQKLRGAIEKYRQDHGLKRILFGCLYTLIASLLLVGALYLLNRLYRTVSTVLRNRLNSKKVSIHIQSFEFIRAERIDTALTMTIKVIRSVIVLVLIYAYIHACLSFFPWTRQTASLLLQYMLIPIKTTGVAVLSEIPNIIYLVIIALFTVYVLKVMRLFFVEIEKETIRLKGFYPETISAVFWPLHLQR